jgi:hypothetical protein
VVVPLARVSYRLYFFLISTSLNLDRSRQHGRHGTVLRHRNDPNESRQWPSRYADIDRHKPRRSTSERRVSAVRDEYLFPLASTARKR